MKLTSEQAARALGPLQADTLDRKEQILYGLITELFLVLRIGPTMAIKVMSAIIADTNTVLGESKH